MNGFWQMAGFWKRGMCRVASAMFLLAGTLLTSATAWAACDVSLVSVFASGQAVLKADCGAASISTITWFLNNNPIPGVTNLTVPIPTTQDIYYTTSLLTTSTSSYTAIGNPGTANEVAAGKAATITAGQTALIVAASAGGTVASNDTPQSISACGSGPSGTCTASYQMGATVTLTPTAGTNYSFSGWSGDCSGNGACVVSMTTPRTVIANFGNAPANGACGASSNSIPITSPPTSLCSSGTATSVTSPSAPSWTYTWGCNGVNGGASTSPTACSVPFQLVGVCGSIAGPVSSTPTAGLCNSGTASAVTTVGSSFTWRCAGANGGATSLACSVAQQQTNGACAAIVSTPTAPTTNGCSAGTVTGMSNTNNTFTWTCAGLAGGTPSGTCSANQTIEPACGASNGQTLSATPTNLCAAGNSASAVSGTGPWNWTCAGVNTATSPASCSASVNVASNAPPNCTVKNLADFNPAWPKSSNVTQAPVHTFGANETIAISFPLSALVTGTGVGYTGRVVLYEATREAVSISATPCEFYNAGDPQMPKNFCQKSGSGNVTQYYLPRNYAAQSTIDSIYTTYGGAYCELPLLPSGQTNVYVNIRWADAASGFNPPNPSTCTSSSCSAKALYY